MKFAFHRARMALGMACLLYMPAAWAQYSGAPTQSSPMPQMPVMTMPRQHIPAYIRDHMLKEQERENQAKIQKEANRLLALAQKLHDLLLKTNHDVLPAAAIAETREIEQLARRLHSRLKNGH